MNYIDEDILLCPLEVSDRDIRSMSRKRFSVFPSMNMLKGGLAGWEQLKLSRLTPHDNGEDGE